MGLDHSCHFLQRDNKALMPMLGLKRTPGAMESIQDALEAPCG